MASISSLDNPVYQHSGETKKIDPIATQASINEDIEKRRRQLDRTGEARKIIIAKEVSHIIDETSTVHLHPAPYPVVHEESILLKTSQTITGAAETVTTAAYSAADAALGAADTVAHVTKEAAIGAKDTVVSAAIAASDTVSHAAHEAADTAAVKFAHAKQDATTALSKAAAYLTGATKTAAGVISHAATEAAHKAVEIGEKVKDSTAEAATVVGHKTLELAEGAAHKAHQVADNLAHFTAIVTIIAAEEKERTRRLTDGDETVAVINAFKISELIHALGPAFYRQAPPNALYGTKLLEEIERRWRLSSSYSAVGAANAHSVGKLVHSNMYSFEHFVPRHQQIRAHIRNIEEKERTRRLNDSDEIYAILNATAVSDLIHELGWPFYREQSFSKLHRAYVTTLLEENERKWRIRTQQLLHTEDSAHLLMDVVATNMDRFLPSTRSAVHFVDAFAKKLGQATIDVAHTFSEKTREFAQGTMERAQHVATDISNFTSMMYVLALEERERSRRLSDPDEARAIINAWNQAALIRQLEMLYRPASRCVFPTRYLELLEQRRRIAEDDRATRKQARLVAEIVNANLSKFELAHEYAAELMRARQVAAQSRLNPKAQPFVPTMTKVEPAPILSNLAAGAQL